MEFEAHCIVLLNHGRAILEEDRLSLYRKYSVIWSQDFDGYC